MSINLGKVWACYAAAVASSFLLATNAGATSTEQLNQIKAAEADAVTTCDSLIHFDTLKYEPCINRLAKNAKELPYKQLGILYSGYVSAMSYAHGGLPGARQTAWRLLDRASKLQKQLEVDSYTLCETLPGNCKIRVRASEEMLRAGPPKPARIPNNQDLHHH